MDIIITIENTSNQWQEVNLLNNKNPNILISEFKVLSMLLEKIYITKQSKFDYNIWLTFILNAGDISIQDSKLINFDQNSNTAIIPMSGYAFQEKMEWKFSIAPFELLDFVFCQKEDPVKIEIYGIGKA